MERLYSWAMAGIDPLLILLPRTGKIGTGAAGMRASVEGFRRWAESNRQVDRPLVWFHAPSVGEGFQAQAVMRSLRALRPDIQIAYTFFSPSAEPFARRAPADVAGYLPVDTRSNARAMLDALRPSAVVFAKTEIWPNLVRECEAREIPALLLSATLPESSSRLGPLARRLLGPAHRRLAAVSAIHETDARRFEALGVPGERRQVSGDARFDQVMQRAAEVVPSVRRPGTLLVAGSTWPADEDILLDAIQRLRREALDIGMVLVPHEPTPAALQRVELESSRRGLSSIRWSALTDDGAVEGAMRTGQLIVVDRVGILGTLYGWGDIAYVGGGFGSAGLHSVLEPAAFGLPVLFGPRHDNAREAGELIGLGGARPVTDAMELTAALRDWIGNAAGRAEAGAAARGYVSANVGAAERGAHLILSHIEPMPA